MQTITIHVAERTQPLTIEVERVTGGLTRQGLADALEIEDMSGNKGRIYINKEQVIAVVISPPTEVEDT